MKIHYFFKNKNLKYSLFLSIFSFSNFFIINLFSMKRLRDSQVEEKSIEKRAKSSGENKNEQHFFLAFIEDIRNMGEIELSKDLSEIFDSVNSVNSGTSKEAINLYELLTKTEVSGQKVSRDIVDKLRRKRINDYVLEHKNDELLYPGEVKYANPVVLKGLIDGVVYNFKYKILKFLDLNLQNKEMEKCFNIFIKRLKNFFNDDYIKEDLFRDKSLNLESEDILYILEPLKKCTKKILDKNGKILIDQYEEIKKILLKEIINVVDEFFPDDIKTLSLDLDLYHVPSYIFKLRSIFDNVKALKDWPRFYENLHKDLPDKYSQNAKEQYKKDKNIFFLALKNIYELLQKKLNGWGPFYSADQFDSWID